MPVQALSYLRNMYEKQTQIGTNTEKSCWDEQRNGETFASETKRSQVFKQLSKRCYCHYFRMKARNREGEKLFKTNNGWF